MNSQPLHYLIAAENGNLAWVEVATFQLFSEFSSLNSDNEIKKKSQTPSPNKPKIPFSSLEIEKEFE